MADALAQARHERDDALALAAALVFAAGGEVTLDSEALRLAQTGKLQVARLDGLAYTYVAVVQP